MACHRTSPFGAQANLVDDIKTTATGSSGGFVYGAGNLLPSLPKLSLGQL
jgi:hypothetical protein